MTAEIPQFGAADAAQSPGLSSALAMGRGAGTPGEQPRTGGFAPLLASALAAGNGRPENAPSAFPALRGAPSEAAPQATALLAMPEKDEKNDRGLMAAPLPLCSPAAAPGTNPETRTLVLAGTGKAAEILAQTQDGRSEPTEKETGEAASARQAVLTASARPPARPSAESVQSGSQPSSQSHLLATPAGKPGSTEDFLMSGRASVAAGSGTAASGSGQAANRATANRATDRLASTTSAARPHRSTHPAPPTAPLPNQPPPLAGGSDPASATGQATASASLTVHAASVSSASHASPAAASSAKDAAFPGLAQESGKVSPEQAAAAPDAGERDASRAGGAEKSTVENAVESAAPRHAASGAADAAHVSLAQISPAHFATAHVSAASASASPPEAATADPVRTSAASPLRSANPYAKLDEAAAPTLVHVSAQRVAVSVHDPVLGELQVRAQAASSPSSPSTQVQASLSTGSAASHAQLSGQLPSLANFLAEQRVAVTRLSVDRELNPMGGSNTGTPPEGGSGGQPSASSGGSPDSSHPRPGGGLPAVAGTVGPVGTAGADPGSTFLGISAWSYINVHA